MSTPSASVTMTTSSDNALPHFFSAFLVIEISQDTYLGSTPVPMMHQQTVMSQAPLLPVITHVFSKDMIPLKQHQPTIPSPHPSSNGDYPLPPTQPKNAHQVLASLPPHIAKLAYPDSQNVNRGGSSTLDSVTYTFVLTTGEQQKLYGYCRRFLPLDQNMRHPVVHCFISNYHIPHLFQQLLEVTHVRYCISTSALFAFLHALCETNSDMLHYIDLFQQQHSLNELMKSKEQSFQNTKSPNGKQNTSNNTTIAPSKTFQLLQLRRKFNQIQPPATLKVAVDSVKSHFINLTYVENIYQCNPPLSCEVKLESTRDYQFISYVNDHIPLGSISQSSIQAINAEYHAHIISQTNNTKNTKSPFSTPEKLIQHDQTYIFPLTQSSTTYQLTDSPFFLLLQSLSCENVKKLFSSILSERRVIFISSNISLLAQCSLAAYHILQPLFSWSHIFIPLLPYSLSLYIDCPSPYIIGLSKQALEQVLTENRKLQGEVILIDLDTDSVTLRSDNTFSMDNNEFDFYLPPILSEKFDKELKKLKTRFFPQSTSNIGSNQNSGTISITSLSIDAMGDLGGNGSSTSGNNTQSILSSLTSLKQTDITNINNTLSIIFNSFYIVLLSIIQWQAVWIPDTQFPDLRRLLLNTDGLVTLGSPSHPNVDDKTKEIYNFVTKTLCETQFFYNFMFTQQSRLITYFKFIKNIPTVGENEESSSSTSPNIADILGLTSPPPDTTIHLHSNDQPDLLSLLNNNTSQSATTTTTSTTDPVSSQEWGIPDLFTSGIQFESQPDPQPPASPHAQTNQAQPNFMQSGAYHAFASRFSLATQNPQSILHSSQVPVTQSSAATVPSNADKLLDRATKKAELESCLTLPEKILSETFDVKNWPQVSSYTGTIKRFQHYFSERTSHLLSLNGDVSTTQLLVKKLVQDFTANDSDPCFDPSTPHTIPTVFTSADYGVCATERYRNHQDKTIFHFVVNCDKYEQQLLSAGGMVKNNGNSTNSSNFVSTLKIFEAHQRFSHLHKLVQIINYSFDSRFVGIILETIEWRLQDRTSQRQWKHSLHSLLLLDALVERGSEHVVAYLSRNAYIHATLNLFLDYHHREDSIKQMVRGAALRLKEHLSSSWGLRGTRIYHAIINPLWFQVVDPQVIPLIETRISKQGKFRHDFVISFAGYRYPTPALVQHLARSATQPLSTQALVEKYYQKNGDVEDDELRDFPPLIGDLSTQSLSQSSSGPNSSVCRPATSPFNPTTPQFNPGGDPEIGLQFDTLTGSVTQGSAGAGELISLLEVLRDQSPIVKKIARINNTLQPSSRSLDTRKLLTINLAKIRSPVVGFKPDYHTAKHSKKPSSTRKRQFNVQKFYDVTVKQQLLNTNNNGTYNYNTILHTPSAAPAGAPTPANGLFNTLTSPTPPSSIPQTPQVDQFYTKLSQNNNIMSISSSSYNKPSSSISLIPQFSSIYQYYINNTLPFSSDEVDMMEVDPNVNDYLESIAGVNGYAQRNYVQNNPIYVCYVPETVETSEISDLLSQSDSTSPKQIQQNAAIGSLIDGDNDDTEPTPLSCDQSNTSQQYPILACTPVLHSTEQLDTLTTVPHTPQPQPQLHMQTPQRVMPVQPSQFSPLTVTIPSQSRKAKLKFYASPMAEHTNGFRGFMNTIRPPSDQYAPFDAQTPSDSQDNVLPITPRPRATLISPSITVVDGILHPTSTAASLKSVKFFSPPMSPAITKTSQHLPVLAHPGVNEDEPFAFSSDSTNANGLLNLNCHISQLGQNGLETPFISDLDGEIATINYVTTNSSHIINEELVLLDYDEHRDVFESLQHQNDNIDLLTIGHNEYDDDFPRENSFDTCTAIYNHKSPYPKSSLANNINFNPNGTSRLSLLARASSPITFNGTDGTITSHASKLLAEQDKMFGELFGDLSESNLVPVFQTSSPSTFRRPMPIQPTTPTRIIDPHRPPAAPSDKIDSIEDSIIFGLGNNTTYATPVEAIQGRKETLLAQANDQVLPDNTKEVTPTTSATTNIDDINNITPPQPPSKPKHSTTPAPASVEALIVKTQQLLVRQLLSANAPMITIHADYVSQILGYRWWSRVHPLFKPSAVKDKNDTKQSTVSPVSTSVAPLTPAPALITPQISAHLVDTGLFFKLPSKGPQRVAPTIPDPALTTTATTTTTTITVSQDEIDQNVLRSANELRSAGRRSTIAKPPSSLQQPTKSCPLQPMPEDGEDDLVPPPPPEDDTLADTTAWRGERSITRTAPPRSAKIGSAIDSDSDHDDGNRRGSEFHRFNTPQVETVEDDDAFFTTYTRNRALFTPVPVSTVTSSGSGNHSYQQRVSRSAVLLHKDSPTVPQQGVTPLNRSVNNPAFNTPSDIIIEACEDEAAFYTDQ